MKLDKFMVELDRLRENILKNNPDAEAQTWNELKIKRSVKAERKLKDRQTSVPSPRGMEG